MRNRLGTSIMDKRHGLIIYLLNEKHGLFSQYNHPKSFEPYEPYEPYKPYEPA